MNEKLESQMNAVNEWANQYGGLIALVATLGTLLVLMRGRQ